MWSSSTLFGVLFLISFISAKVIRTNETFEVPLDKSAEQEIASKDSFTVWEMIDIISRYGQFNKQTRKSFDNFMESFTSEERQNFKN
ncbi:hypothetical protein Q1695_011945 [Nippostrongylus brasiliensis]|nr:hypothetical protein Q1695_011945 [Nippostrongylus brasiliensis]